jgi:serine/threonine-protein kinase
MRSARPRPRSIAAPPPPSGELLAGKYRVESLIGEGGIGTVLAAHHELLDLPVAVKILSPEFVRSPATVGRFLGEARAAAQLKSEHVARVTDAGTLETGQPYVVMELLRGEDLEHRADRLGTLPAKEVVDAVLQALEAMSQAHAVGIVHRDLKPANLFLTQLPDGRELLKVLDFGIAKLIDSGGAPDAPSLTGGHALGSPSYMAPEQIRNGSQMDHRVDIWAFGAILYDLLTGQLPFPGDTFDAISSNVLVGSAPPLRTHRSDLSEGLEAAVARCLDREPAKRFADVHELARALAPHGSGAWDSYVPRIAQTLARRGAPQRLEDTSVRRSPYGRSDRPPKEGNHETVVGQAIQSVRPSAAAMGKRRVFFVTAGVVIAAFAALGVLRPRASTRPATVSPPASAPAAQEERAGATIAPLVTVAAPTAAAADVSSPAVAASLPPPSSGGVEPPRRRPTLPTDAKPKRGEVKRSVPLDSP